ARERDAADERRVHEQRPFAQHQWAPAGASTRAAGGPTRASTRSGGSPTLPQPRPTGKRPLSSSLLRSVTYLSPVPNCSSDCVVRSPTSIRMKGQKYALPLKDTRAVRNG